MKISIREVARELVIKEREVVEIATELGVSIKDKKIGLEDAAKIVDYFPKWKEKQRKRGSGKSGRKREVSKGEVKKRVNSSTKGRRSRYEERKKRKRKGEEVEKEISQLELTSDLVEKEKERETLTEKLSPKENETQQGIKSEEKRENKSEKGENKSIKEDKSIKRESRRKDREEEKVTGERKREKSSKGRKRRLEKGIKGSRKGEQKEKVEKRKESIKREISKGKEEQKIGEEEKQVEKRIKGEERDTLQLEKKREKRVIRLEERPLKFLKKIEKAEEERIEKEEIEKTETTEKLKKDEKKGKEEKGEKEAESHQPELSFESEREREETIEKPKGKRPTLSPGLARLKEQGLKKVKIIKKKDLERERLKEEQRRLEQLKEQQKKGTETGKVDGIQKVETTSSPEIPIFKRDAKLLSTDTHTNSQLVREIYQKEDNVQPTEGEKKAQSLSNRELPEGSVESKKKKRKKEPPKKREEKELEVDLKLGELNLIEEEQVELLDLSLNEIILTDEELEQKTKKPTSPKEERKVSKKRRPSTSQEISKTPTKKKKKRKKEREKEGEGLFQIPKEVRVYQFAEIIGKQLEEVLEKLEELGEVKDKNDFIDAEYIETLAEELGVGIEIYDPLAKYDYVKQYDQIEEPEEKLVERPPIVTVMGHVDHGKTSLLDKIRNSRIAAREAGGITQHIGAYMVEREGKQITFIDTPGHEAFTEMRARGAQVTDIAVIVVAANDGVMPQTREALSHAQVAEVPFIIAINKIDLPEANPDLVKSQLAELGITPIEWGGDVEFVEVSARTGEGIEDLLDTILMTAEGMELKANPSRPAKGIVIESKMEKGRGPVATIILKNGTLRRGDSFVCGITYGRVRTIINDLGKQQREIKPGEPGEVSGFNELPLAGDILIGVKSDKIAKETAQKWKEYLEEREKSKSTKTTLEDLQKMLLEGELKKLPVIVKGDTQGSLEAIRGSLAKLKNDEVKVNLIHGDVGAINENDVILARASEPPAIILGFNVRPTTGAKNKAKQEGVEIRTYSVIYDLIDDVKELLSGLMAPKIKEEVTGTLEVRQVFNIPKVGNVAGCYVQEGIIHRNDFIRVIRNGVVIYDSRLASLKRFKEDVKEVGKGFECGVMVDGYNDIKVGDILEGYRKVEEKPTFE